MGLASNLLQYFLPPLSSMGAIFGSSFLSGSPVMLLLMWHASAWFAVFQSWIFQRLHFGPTVKATFTWNHTPYKYLMSFWMDEQLWRGPRDFLITSTRDSGEWVVPQSKLTNTSFFFRYMPWMTKASTTPTDSEKENHGDAEFEPVWRASTSFMFRWDGHWIDVNVVEQPDSHRPPQFQLNFLTTDLGVVTDFTKYLHSRYSKPAINPTRTTVILPERDRDGDMQWGILKKQPLRPLETVNLPGDHLDKLVQGIQEFFILDSWYEFMGVPHRRGILLYGPPGTGKTTTVQAIAGALQLPIYSLALSGTTMNDQALQSLAAAVPKRAILLLEDIDCAFVSREGNPLTEVKSQSKGRTSSVTMSGLLNVLDGVGSSNDQVFIATTNYIEHLDPALIRPGRVDIKVEYRKSAAEQTRAMFLHFYPLHRYTPVEVPDKASADMDQAPSMEETIGTSVDLDKTPSIKETIGTSVNLDKAPSIKETIGTSVDKTPSIEETIGTAVNLDKTPSIKETVDPTSIEVGKDKQVIGHFLPCAVDTSVPLYTPLSELADTFTTQIPEYEVTTAELQGFLVSHKFDPELAVREAKGWVESMRAEKMELERMRNGVEGTPPRLTGTTRMSRSHRAKRLISYSGEESVGREKGSSEDSNIMGKIGKRTKFSWSRKGRK